jgi:hypothetical protein
LAGETGVGGHDDCSSKVAAIDYKVTFIFVCFTFDFYGELNLKELV